MPAIARRYFGVVGQRNLCRGQPRFGRQPNHAGLGHIMTDQRDFYGRHWKTLAINGAAFLLVQNEFFQQD